MKVTRLDAMEQYILQNEKVTIAQLQRHFDVSVNTLRRDLDELERRGHVGKVYGGAAARMVPSLTSMPKRFQMNVQHKHIIGELAASVIPDDATVFIDSGSTTFNIVRFLGGKQRLTLVSHSLVALNEGSRLKKVNLISLGGIYNASIGAFVGISTFDMIKTLSMNVAVMAATGVSIKHGLSNTTYFEAEVKRTVVSSAEKIILMADHTKFDRDALITYCPLERVSTVVTDREPPKEYRDFFEKYGIQALYPSFQEGEEEA
ncbi:MAG: DeoR/GlpR family DNA-binding transcription regulator [Candidatus Limiplasma sp.]|nr:DeoR/GlpR family DNA-binding transcription regulator [Candidatus Limiplasma sp.]